MKAFSLGLIFLIIISVFLRIQTIRGSSPTFDEMFHVAQSVSLHQFNTPYQLDVHPLMLPWTMSWTLPYFVEFQNIHEFSSNPQNFKSPYQYRMDKMSSLSEDQVMEGIRYFSQAFWFILILSTFFILKAWKLASQNILLILSFLLLEPWLLGFTSLMTNDMAVSSFLFLGTALALCTQPWIWALSALSS